MAGAGPMTPGELAKKTGANERYLREWLCAQAAGGYVTYDPTSGKFTLPDEQALVLAVETARSGLFMAYQIVVSTVKDGAEDPRGARLGRVSAGTSIVAVCSKAPSGFSGRATPRTLSHRGAIARERMPG